MLFLFVLLIGATLLDTVRATTTVFDSLGNLDTITDLQGNITDLDYDAAGRLLSEQVSWNRGTVQITDLITLRNNSYTYYDDGLLRTFDDGRSAVSAVNASYEYDQRGLQTRFTQYLGNTSYTPTGAQSLITNQIYYADGSLRQVNHPDGHSTEYLYNSEFTSLNVTGLDGETDVRNTDVARNWVRTNSLHMDFSGTGDAATTQSQIVEARTDRSGRTLWTRNQLTGATDAVTYDTFDRVLSQTAVQVQLNGAERTADNRKDITSYVVYDAVGNVLYSASPDVARRRSHYDIRDRLIRTEVFELGGGVMSYTYDVDGDLLSRKETRLTPLTDADHEIIGYDSEDFETEYTYNGFGDVLTITVDPGSDSTDSLRVTRYGYDTIGHINSTQQETTNGTVLTTTTYLQDALGRTRQTNNPDGSQTTTNYDNAGNLTETLVEFDSSNQTATSFRRSVMTYDGANRLVETARSASRTGTNVADLVTRITYVDGGTAVGVASVSTTNLARRDAVNVPQMTQFMDAIGRMVRIDQPSPAIGGTALTTRFEYDDTATTGVSETYVIDPMNVRTRSISNTLGQTLVSFDRVTNTTDRDEQDREMVRITYDFAGRVVQRESRRDGSVFDTVNYVFDDASGQILETTISDSQNGPTAVTKTFRDSAGNAVLVVDPTDHWTLLKYDGLGRVTYEATRVETFDPDTTQIDGTVLADRVWQYNGLLTTRRDRNGEYTIEADDPANNQTREYWFGTGIDFAGVLHATTVADVNALTATPSRIIETNRNADGSLNTISETINATNGTTLGFTYDQFGRKDGERRQSQVNGVWRPDVRTDTDWLAIGVRDALDIYVDLSHDTNTADDIKIADYSQTVDRLGRVTGVSFNNNAVPAAPLWANSAPGLPISARIAYWDDGQIRSIERFRSATYNGTTAGFSYWQYDAAGRLLELDHFRTQADADLQTNGFANAEGNIARHAVGRDPSGRVLIRATVFYDNAGGALLQERLRYQYSPRGVDTIELESPFGSGTYVTHQNPDYDAAGNQTGATIGLDNRLLSVGTVNNGTTYAYDREGRLTRSERISVGVGLTIATTTVYRYDQRGRVTQITESETTTTEGNSPSTSTKSTSIIYDPLDRRIERTLTIGGTTTVTSYIHDGQQILGELDIAGTTVVNGGVSNTPGQIVRMNLVGPGGELLATDQARSGVAGQATATLWAFADQSGSITTWALFDATPAPGNNLVEVRHEQLGTYGSLVAAFGSNAGVLTAAETIFNGWRQEPVTGLYEANGRLYDPVNNRFTTQGAVSPESPNPYLLNNNDPLNKERDWSGIEGPGAFGAAGAFGYGAWDAITFGHFDDVFGTTGAQAQAAQNDWYYAGMAFGVASQIAIGNIAGAAGGGVSGAYLAYDVVGNVVGTYDAVAAMRNGTFGPLDALGLGGSLAGIAGYASGLSRAARAGRVAGAADEIVSAARVANHSPSRLGVLNSSFDVSDEFLGSIGQSRVCFVADTRVAVPGIYDTRYFAGSTPNTDDGSGSWVACGVVSLFGAQILFGDRKKRSRQIHEANPWEQEGLWWTESEPDLDLSGLNFDDVCDDLLTGSPGMS